MVLAEGQYKTYMKGGIGNMCEDCAAILARMKRMEDALREITNVTSKCLSHEEMKDKMKHIAKVALEEKP